MNLTSTFHTNRLIAKRIVIEDAELLYQMHRDPDVMATLGGFRSQAETDRFLHVNLIHWEKYGFGLWMFHLKESNQFVGRGGLRNVDIEGVHEVELGYALMPSFWGKGFATEMANAILQTAFDHFKMESVVAFTLTTNRASQRVMEKAGFSFEREIIHADMPHVLYRINQEEFNWSGKCE